MSMPTIGATKIASRPVHAVARPAHVDVYAARSSLRSDDVRTPAKQLGFQMLRQRKRARDFDRRPRDRESAIRTGADERGDAVSLQRQPLFDREQVCFCTRTARLDLANAAERFEAVLVPMPEQCDRLGTNFERCDGGIVCRVPARQLGVRRSDCRREHQPCLRRFSLRCVRL